MVVRQGGAFRRDPASQFLTATSGDGWTIWVPDLTTIEALVRVDLSTSVAQQQSAEVLLEVGGLYAGVQITSLVKFMAARNGRV